MPRCRPVLVLLLLLAAPARGQEPTTRPAVAAIEAFVAEHRVPGLSCAIAVGGRSVLERGFGLADVENAVPATATTVYRLASISKPITAVLAMQLAERGELDLDADVHRIVPAWPEQPWPVTTRQLLAHLGGVRHYRGEAESTVPYATQTASLGRFAGDPLVHEPGTKHLYSTYGFNLVAAVLEARAGAPFARLVQERIAGPCAAPTLQADDSRRLIRGRAQGYVLVDGELQNSALMDSSYKLGGGGLCASAPDLLRFALALQDGRLVRAETLAAMWSPQQTRAGKVLDYGLGFGLGRHAGRREVSHSGAQARVSTLLYLLPDQGLVVVLLCNLERVRLLPLARRLGEIVLEGQK